MPCSGSSPLERSHGGDARSSGPLVPAGVIAQLTSGVYLGWFLIFSLGIAAAVAVWLPSTRWPFLAVLRRDAPWIALSAVLGWLVLRIWVSHQLAASLELGSRYYQYVVQCLPHPPAWLCVSQSSWLEGWTIGLVERLGWQVQNWQPCGIGLVTTVAGSTGLYLARERRWVRLLVMVAFVLFASVTVFPGVPLVVLGTSLTLAAGAIAFQRGRDDPLAFLGFVAMVLVALNVAPMNFAALLGSGVGLYTLVIALLAFERWEGTGFARFLLGVLMAGLVFVLMPAWLALALGAVFGGLLAAAVAVCGWRSRRQLESVILGGDPVLLRPGDLLGPAVDARCRGAGPARRRRGEAGLRTVPRIGVAAPEHRGFRAHGDGDVQLFRNGLAYHQHSSPRGETPCSSSRGSA